MNTIFGYDESYLKEIKGYITAKEIRQQPKLWLETVDIIKNNRKAIEKFLDEVAGEKNLRIIFAGAGTSAFVGECVVPYLNRKLPHRVEAIATTDIVSNPEDYLHSDIPTLLISCARSGNSPESVATVELAERLIDNLYQIILTCNSEGNLAKKDSKGNKSLLILMPENSNDQGFAMTGSFTTMVLSSLLVFDTDGLENIEKDIETIVSLGEDILENKVNIIKEFVACDHERVIYLGSSSLKGLARESALKLLELTRGKVVADYNTPLGFRHGPKSIINDKTLIVSYLSNVEYTRQYEIDLLKEMSQEDDGKKIITISSYKDDIVEKLVDHSIVLNEENKEFEDDAFLVLIDILFAQMFALFNSIRLGITPDDPSPDGIVNRVVKGVVIHPYCIDKELKK